MPCGSQISTKSLYLTRLRRYKQFCVFPFLAKIRKFKMAATLGEGKTFLKLPIVHSSVTLRVKKFRKSLYLARLRRYKQFCVFPFLVKIQNGRHFGGGENFFKTVNSTFLSYPVGQKISTKSLYLTRLRRYKQFCVFPVLGKIRKFQIAAIFGEGKFFQIWQDYIL